MTTPQHTPPHEVVARALGRYGGQWDWSPGSAHAAVRQCRMDADRALAALTAAGYRIIQTDPLGLDVDTSAIDPEAEVTIPMWRWHVLTCHSNRLRRLVGNEQDTP